MVEARLFTEYRYLNVDKSRHIQVLSEQSSFMGDYWLGNDRESNTR